MKSYNKNTMFHGNKKSPFSHEVFTLFSSLGQGLILCPMWCDLRFFCYSVTQDDGWSPWSRFLQEWHNTII